MGNLKIVVIGAGQVARTTHLPILSKMKDVEIAAVCDVNGAAAEAIAESFGIAHWYTDHRQMLQTEHPDAAWICVPNRFHHDTVMDTLKAGCHVLCEKPPAMNPCEAAEMEEEAKKQGKLLTYGFHFRHCAQVKLLRKMIGAGSLVNIYHTEVRWTRRRGIPGWGNFTNKKMQGGGPLIDIGAHMLDAALYLLDYPEIAYVTASSSDRIGKQGGTGRMGKWEGDSFTVEDGLFGRIQFRDGSDLQLSTAFALNQKEENLRNILLYGDQMGASLFPTELYGERDGHPFETNISIPQDHDWHEDCDRNFVKACRGEEPLLVTAAEGTYIQKLIHALYQSAESGGPVIW